MKIRYQNGFSISLWSNEFKEIEVTEEEVKYLTQDDQWMRIRVPSQWSQNSSSSSQSPSPLANELAEESNEGRSPSSSLPDLIEETRRRIDGLQTTWEAKIAELARDLRSVPEVNLKELETKIKDSVENGRRGFVLQQEDHRRSIQEFKQKFVETDDKLNRVANVLEIIKDHDLTLKEKIQHFFHPNPNPESDKSIKNR